MNGIQYFSFPQEFVACVKNVHPHVSMWYIFSHVCLCARAVCVSNIQFLHFQFSLTLYLPFRYEYCDHFYLSVCVYVSVRVCVLRPCHFCPCVYCPCVNSFVSDCMCLSVSASETNRKSDFRLLKQTGLADADR